MRIPNRKAAAPLGSWLKIGILIQLLLSIFSQAWAVQEEPHDPALEEQVMAVLDVFSAAFNNGDVFAQTSVMHFPHYRFARGRMTVIESLDPHERIVKLEKDWHHTAWDSRRIVGWSKDKVHVDVQFTRYREDDTPIESFRALYILTKEKGKWGIKMRSSFAP